MLAIGAAGGTDGPAETAEAATDGPAATTQSQLGGLTSGTAPGDQFDDSFRSMTVTDTSFVAEEDVVVATIQSQSLVGAIEDEPGSSTTERFRSLVESDQASFALDQRTGGSSTLNLAATAQRGGLRVVTDGDAGTVSVMLDEDALRFEGDHSRARTGETYRMQFTLEPESGLVDSSETVSDRVRFTKRVATFARGDDGQVAMTNTADATISGVTSVAPGTELRLDLRSVDDGIFTRRPTAVVVADRTFAATVDMSSVPTGTNFRAKVEDTGDISRGVIVGSGPVPTATPQETETFGPTTTERRTTMDTTTSEMTTDGMTTDGMTTDGADETTTELQTLTDTGGPGFTVVVALVAVLSLAVVGIRRGRDD